MSQKLLQGFIVSVFLKGTVTVILKALPDLQWYLIKFFEYTKRTEYSVCISLKKC